QFQRLAPPGSTPSRNPMQPDLARPMSPQKVPFFGEPWKASFEAGADGTLRAKAEDDALASLPPSLPGLPGVALKPEEAKALRTLAQRGGEAGLCPATGGARKRGACDRIATRLP